MMLTTLATLATLLAPADTVITRGAALPTTAAVPMATVLAAPAQYSKAPVLVEGVIVKSCTVEGCWMQLAPSAEESGVRVTFKDESFVIPLNAAGMTARAFGTVVTTKHSKADADHLISEGAKLIQNADGTAIEVGFIATGVELRRK
jgi:hypothetical protein